MTLAEFKLVATGVGILLLLGGVIAWTIYDLLMEREKRKHRLYKNRPKKQQRLCPDVPIVVTEAIGDTGMTVRLYNGKIVIAEIEPRSLASKAGLRPGFVIEDIGGVSIKDLRARLS